MQMYHKIVSGISLLHYWLVSHPRILHFKWKQGETLGSSPLFLVSTVISYLSLTLILSRTHLPPLSPKLLRSITAFHNIALLSLSFIMALGCFLSVISIAPDLRYIVCFPKNTPPSGPLFFWSYIFYLSKYVEFIDTLLIIFSTSSTRRLTFLHVYHHATVVITAYIGVHNSQSCLPLGLMANASVHVLMYTYYLLCALGLRPKWKRLVTDVQILQFISSFGAMGLIAYYHVTGSGCSGIWSFCVSVAFMTSLLVLFVDFRSKSYSVTEKKSN